MKFQSLFAGASICALAISSPLLALGESAAESQPDASPNPTGPSQTVEVVEEIIMPVERVDRTPILVRANRTENGLRINDYTGSATIISDEQIAQRQVRNVEDVLRDVPGIAVGSVAGQTQIRIRGAEANHVLVLVDGIEVSDPGSGEFDIGTLQAEIGSRIEVLRGPQSALYGNDAVAGVIAYESRRFDGFSAYLEGGTNNTVNGAARWGYNLNGVDASLSAVVVSSDGEPNARAINGNGVRDIGRDSYSFAGKVSANVSNSLELRAVARFSRTEGDSNDQDFDFTSPTLGLVIDSPGVGFESEALSGLVGAELETLNGDWMHDLSLQFTDAERQTAGPFGLTSSTTSDRFKASYVSTYQFGDSGHSLTFAADYEVEGFNNVGTFDDRKSHENTGFVGEYRYAGDRFDFSAAVRHDVNDLFRDATTFRLGAGASLTDTTRLRASIGSGVKNPTLSELFGFFDGVFIGNPDLEPEESTSWEVGADQSFGNGAAVFSLTYFNAELDREIFTSFGPPPAFLATPANRTTESAREGIELAISAQIGQQWSLDAAYTWLDAEENGATELRRPESTASAALSWTPPSDKASATLLVRHNGAMTDTDFGSFSTVTLDDFTLVNFNASYELAEGLKLFARAENLLDEQYEQVFSFVSPGRSVIAGFEATF